MKRRKSGLFWQGVASRRLGVLTCQIRGENNVKTYSLRLRLVGDEDAE